MRCSALPRRAKKPASGAFDGAPTELKDVADTFGGMTDTIMREEARIEDALRQKDVLLREVHHRVKNNLQLIASIMSMQMRQSRSPEVQQLLQGLHDRVNSLATIHRSLYQTTGQADVRMNEQLDIIVRQVVRMASARNNAIKLETNFTELHLNPDQAVPLSLFVTEAMTNALKYIGAKDGADPILTVNLTLPGDEIAEVLIVNSTAPDAIPLGDDRSSGLGSELMEAFAEQLEGTFSATPDAGMFTVKLSFPIEPLSPKPVA